MLALSFWLQQQQAHMATIAANPTIIATTAAGVAHMGKPSSRASNSVFEVVVRAVASGRVAQLGVRLGSSFRFIYNDDGVRVCVLSLIHI